LIGYRLADIARRAVRTIPAVICSTPPSHGALGTEIGALHVGLKGTMNALYLTDLRAKVRRGLEGRVRQGRSGGGLCYGYDVVREIDLRGEPVYGGRSINHAKAAVVCSIFEAFAAGKSPRVIARGLNDQRISGPGGVRGLKPPFGATLYGARVFCTTSFMSAASFGTSNVT